MDAQCKVEIREILTNLNVDPSEIEEAIVDLDLAFGRYRIRMRQFSQRRREIEAEIRAEEGSVSKE